MQSTIAPLDFCPICGRQLNRREMEANAHRECCRHVFGLDKLPTLQRVEEWKEYVHPASSSSYLVSLHQDPLNRILRPSCETHARFLLKAPMIADKALANKQIENEWMTMLLARAFGIPALWGALVPIEENRKGFIIPRIDRKTISSKTHPIHIATLAQIYRRPDHHRPTTIADRGIDITRMSAYPRADAIDFLLRLLFSFIFSVPACEPKKLMLQEPGDPQRRRLAPAYGLRFSRTSPNKPDDSHTSLLADRKRYLLLAHSLQLNRQTADRLLHRVFACKGKLLWILRTIPLRELCEERRNFQNLVERRYDMLNILA